MRFAPKSWTQWTLLLAVVVALGFGTYQSARHFGIVGDQGVVRAVSAGADLSVDAGMSKCIFTGYIWSCTPCAKVQVPIGSDATIDGHPSSQEWVSTDAAATFSEARSLQTMAIFKAAAPPYKGCVNPAHHLELRLLDGQGMLHSDRLTVNVRCCGE
jgi:hypothetical protein